MWCEPRQAVLGDRGKISDGNRCVPHPKNVEDSRAVTCVATANMVRFGRTRTFRTNGGCASCVCELCLQVPNFRLARNGPHFVGLAFSQRAFASRYKPISGWSLHRMDWNAELRRLRCFLLAEKQCEQHHDHRCGDTRNPPELAPLTQAFWPLQCDELILEFLSQLGTY